MNSLNSTNATFDTVLEMSINSLMSQIRNYTEDQLQALLGDEDRLNAMVDSMPQVSSLIMDKDLKLAQCKSYAEYNLSMEPKLNEACELLKSTHESATQLKEEVDILKKRLDSVAENRSLDAIGAILQAAAQEAEEESEAIGEKFQDGEIQAEDFIKQYNEKRVLTHKRKIKADKLLEVLRQQQYQPTNTATSSNPSPSLASQLPGYPNSGMSRFAAYPHLNSGGRNARHSYFR